MYKIFYEPNAESDLLEIIIYYAENNSFEYANQIQELIKNDIKSLENMPYRVRQSILIPETREFLISKLPYKVFLKIDEKNKKIFILNIVHTSRKFP